MDAIKPYLEDLENRIDPQVEDALLAEWRDFIDDKFSGDIFSPRRGSKNPPKIDWPDVTVNQTLDDFEMLALQQLKMCSDMLTEGNGAMMCVRSNYGTGILASPFDVDVFIMPDETNTLPTNHPFNDRDKIQAVIDKGIPQKWQGFAAKALEMAHIFEDIRNKYPKIGKYVHHYHPDTQGPMDICELLWGASLFVDLYDVPDMVKQLLEIVTETYIRFMKDWTAIVPFTGGYSVHWCLYMKGYVALREDSAMNLSPDMFDEFIRPYSQRVLDTFGGGISHFCGRGDHFIDRLCAMPGLTGIAMSQPEYNDMEKIYQGTVDKGIKLLGLARWAADEAVKNGRNLHGCVHCL